MRKTFWQAASSLAALSVVLTAAAPASATQKDFYDETGETNNSGLMDIGKVTVINTKSKVIVKARIPKLDEYNPAGTFELYLDTNKKKKGPEFLWAGGFPGDDGFFTLKNWKVSKTWYSVAGEGKCGKAVRTRFDLENGVLSFSIVPKKGCSGRPKSVRAYVHTLVTAEYSEPDYSDWVNYENNESDYFPAKKKFSKWVNR